MNIVISDVHPLVGVALREMLSAALPGARIDAVGLQGTLFGRLQARTVDLLILEPRWPGQLQGLRLLESVVNLSRNTGVVVHTGNEHPTLALAALDLGVAGYVLKSSDPRVVVQAAMAVSSGGRYIDSLIDLSAARDHPWYRLTEAERSVVIALSKGESLTELALQRGRSYKTVSAQKYSALGKLGLRNGADVRRYLTDQGLEYWVN